MKIGFIGCGNMASAIIGGIRAKRNNEDEIFAYDLYKPAVDKCGKEYSVIACDSECDVVSKSEIIFLAVKPNVIASVLEKIDGDLKENNPLVISIAAGKTLEFLGGCLKNPCRLVRVMPNINAKVGEAISAYCCNENVVDDDKKHTEILLDCIGGFVSLDESYFPLFGVIGGCAPAFTYMYIDALARAAVKNGMKKDEALKISAQTVLGSAKLVLESGEHPWRLIDNVCSPGGTTVEGVVSLQENGFESAVHKAVECSLNKDKKL